MARKLAFDRLLFATVLLLVLLGLVMVQSSTAPLVRGEAAMSAGGALLANPLLIKQCIAVALGLAGMLVLMHIDYRVFKKPALLYPLIAGITMLLVAVLFTPEINGSRRWLRLAGLSFQPSELAKLVLVLYLAYQIERKRERIDHYSFLIPVLGLTLFFSALIMAGKDLGTTVLLCLPAGLMVFLAGLSMRFVFAGGLVVLPMVVLAIASQDYRRRRMLAFLDPEADRLGFGFQLLQSLIAVGSGGLFGLGPGGSVQKLHFLPSPHADFIFSIVAEELGFFGSLLFIGLFAVLLWRGVVAGQQAPEAFGRYFAWGLTALLVGQALVHMSVALGVMPTTGVPLPFISHGGSSVITSLLAAGLILNVSQHGGGP
ncbi:MAG: putative lipid II flippase FtsW [Acidobacteriota bacterium]